MIEALIDPWPPFTFCRPQAIVDQDAGVSIPNISLLPLDEVPVHVPLRRPRPLRFERLRVPVWNPYSRDLNLTAEFKYKHQPRDTPLRLSPQLPHTPWGRPPP